MKNGYIIGIILLISGFIINAINAVDYLGGFFGLSLGIRLFPSIVGVIFVVLGIFLAGTYSARKKKKV